MSDETNVTTEERDPAGSDGPLERYFKLREHGTSVRTEVIAGDVLGTSMTRPTSSRRPVSVPAVEPG